MPIFPNPWGNYPLMKRLGENSLKTPMPREFSNFYNSLLFAFLNLRCHFIRSSVGKLDVNLKYKFQRMFRIQHNFGKPWTRPVKLHHHRKPPLSSFVYTSVLSHFNLSRQSPVPTFEAQSQNRTPCPSRLIGNRPVHWCRLGRTLTPSDGSEQQVIGTPYATISDRNLSILPRKCSAQLKMPILTPSNKTTWLIPTD